ncbi:MAG: DUF2516 family protein [Acidimicrobiia bacterium]
MNLGPTELIILLVMVGFIAVPVWALVDALRATDAQWAAIGQQRTIWVALIAVGTFFGGFPGMILAIVYLVSVRPKLLSARGAGA